MQTKSPRVCAGIAEIADEHDVFLLDMWGVMHDGSNPYPGVLETVKKLKDAGKEMIILSNSSKRKDNSFKMLTKLGFNPSDFTDVITSGDVSQLALCIDFIGTRLFVHFPSITPPGVISHASG
jgi:HAD superfamily hydrolase (TIGR01459 family)